MLEVEVGVYVVAVQNYGDNLLAPVLVAGVWCTGCNGNKMDKIAAVMSMCRWTERKDEWTRWMDGRSDG